MVTSATWESFFNNHSASFEEAFYGQFNRVQTVREQVFGEMDLMNSDVSNHQGTTQLGLLDRFDTVNKIQYDETAPLWLKTIQSYEFAKGVSIPRKVVLFNRYQQVIRDLTNLGRATERTIEYFATAALNGAGATTFSFRGSTYDNTSPDSKAVCATNHQYASGTSGTQSNKVTVELTPANLKSAREAMVTMKGNKAETDILIEPDILLVGEKLKDRALQIVGSMQELDTGNNNVNTLNPNNGSSLWTRGLRIVSSPLIDSGASEAVSKWFLIDSSLAKESAIFQWSHRPQLENDIDFNSKRARYSVYTLFGLGYTEWRWIYGSFPT